MKQLLSRTLVGLVFALPLALLSFALVQAGSPQQEPVPAQQCVDCHPQYQAAWVTGSHGQALQDPKFVEAWGKQGQPPECLTCHAPGYDPNSGTFAEEGVTCEACHDPVPADHPLAPAAMSRSASMCGNCHRETEFEWQNSRHGQSDLTCVSCHDPHATTLRTQDTSELCASCHGTRVDAYSHSQHAEQGLTCTDCHIGETGSEPGMGNAVHSHSFEVNLTTCTKCHEDELHSPSAAMLLTGQGEATPQPPDSLNSGHPSTVSISPAPVSPLGFAIFTGLIGMAFGIVLAPWLERGFRRLSRPEKPSQIKP